MSIELKDMKPFNQIPYWDKNAVIQITGAEYEAIYNFMNLFSSPLMASQSIFQKNLKNGTIKIKYEYEDGSGEVSEEEVKEFTVKMQEFLKEKYNQ